jgi:hypothetical protein
VFSDASLRAHAEAALVGTPLVAATTAQHAVVVLQRRHADVGLVVASLSEAAPFAAAAAAITDGIAPADPIRAMSVRRFMVGQ